MTFEEKLNLVLKYPEMIEAIADVLNYGISKGYAAENWLKPEGSTMSNKANFDSGNHHRAKHFAGYLYDESGLLHLAHSGTRDLMALVRVKRGIIHPEDKQQALQNRANDINDRLNALYYFQELNDDNCLTIDEAINKYSNSQYFFKKSK